MFFFIKNKSSKNQSNRRSPRKRCLITQFVKPKNFERLSFANFLLKQKVKVPEEKKNLKKNQNVVTFMLVA